MTGRVPYRDFPSCRPNIDTVLRIGTTVGSDTAISIAIQPDPASAVKGQRIHTVALGLPAALALISDLVARVGVLTAPIAPHQLTRADEWTSAGRVR